MIGKSYDGTLSNGVAATGVDGLTTIVPISAISRWYDYSRTNGIRHNTNYPGNSLANTVTNADRRTLCAPTRDAMNDIDGDETGDINAVLARARPPQGRRQREGVGVRHARPPGRQRPLGPCSAAGGTRSRRNNVPRKLWLTRTGHEDPFDFRRAEWVDTLHRWFDLWLQGVPNGIMDEPKVDIEIAADTFETASDWPVPGRADDDVFLRGTAPGTPATSALSSGGATDTLSWTDAPGQSENTMMNNPLGSQTNRRVFLSPELTTDLRISGTPVIDIEAVGEPHPDEPRRAAGGVRPDHAGLADQRRHRQRTRTAAADGAPRRAAASRARTTAPATSTSSTLDDQRHRRGGSRRASWTPRTATRCSPDAASLITIDQKYRFTLADVPARLRVHGRQPDRDRPRRQLHAVQLGQRHHGRDRDAGHEDEQGEPADRRRLRGAAVASGAFAPTPWRPRSAGMPRRRGRDHERRRRAGHLPAPDGDRQRGSGPGRDLHAAVRRACSRSAPRRSTARRRTPTATRRPAASS